MGRALAYDDLPLIWEMVVLRDRHGMQGWHGPAIKVCRARGIPIRRVQTLRKKATRMEREGTLPTGPQLPRDVAAGLDAIYAREARDRETAKAEESRLLAVARESGLEVPDGADAESLAASLGRRLGEIKQHVSYSTDQIINHLMIFRLPRSELDRRYAELKAEEAQLERQIEILDGIVRARRTIARTDYVEDR